MWKIRELLRRLGKIDHLETALEALQKHPTLGIDPSDIVSLRADQGHLKQASVAFGDQLELFGSQMGEVTRRLDETRLAVSEGIERVDRAERRIKATVKRARSELASRGFQDDGLDAENFELQLLDGDGSEPSELPAVHETVEAVKPEASSVAGVPIDTLRKVRGI